MSEPRRFRLRVVYNKAGRLALLSHLEVIRTLERYVRRAGLPFAVTQGFSPHMKAAFGSALPVGVGSVCEIFDIYLTDYVKPAAALAALQDADVADMPVISCAYVEPSSPAASMAFPLSDYVATLSAPVDGIVAPESIDVIRKGKPKTLAVSDFLVGEVAPNGTDFSFTLEAKETGSLRPDVFAAACIEATAAARAMTAEETPSLASLVRISQRAKR